jgi:hypothetical protein
LIFCETVPLLNLAFELVPTTIYDVKIVVSELPPLLLDPAFDLLPISFDSMPVSASPAALAGPVLLFRSRFRRHHFVATARSAIAACQPDG